MNETIQVKGARVNNLKNVDIDIPRDKLIVITGLSGSGKSRWPSIHCMPRANDAMLRAFRPMHVNSWAVCTSLSVTT